MHVRIVDYVLNPGGFTRIIAEILDGFRAICAPVDFEVVSYGPAAEAYASLLKSRGLCIPITRIRPSHWWNNQTPRRILNIRGTRRLMWLLGWRDKWDWELPPAAFEACDVVWVPFMSRHRIPHNLAHKAVACCHDILTIELPIIPENSREIEIELTRENLESRAVITAISKSARDSIARYFGMDPSRMLVVPWSTEHFRKPSLEQAANPLGKIPFILCASLAMPYKNHDVLIRAFSQWQNRGDWRLVLIGRWTNLADAQTDWSRSLRELVERMGLRLGADLLGLGYVPTETCDALLVNAKALVVPTLHEGFGLPVGEGVTAGVPVIASDIPVLREQMELMGGELLWFDPNDPGSLLARLTELKNDYSAIKRKAVEQVARIRRRTWADVAEDQLRIFEAVAARA